MSFATVAVFYICSYQSEREDFAKMFTMFCLYLYQSNMCKALLCCLSISSTNIQSIHISTRNIHSYHQVKKLSDKYAITEERYCKILSLRSPEYFAQIIFKCVMAKKGKSDLCLSYHDNTITFILFICKKNVQNQNSKSVNL